MSNVFLHTVRELQQDLITFGGRNQHFYFYYKKDIHTKKAPPSDLRNDFL